MNLQPGYDPRTLHQPMVGGVPMAQPPGMMAPGIAMAPIQVGMNGMEMLGMLQAIQIQEKANLIQELTAMIGTEVQMANKYNILDSAGNQLFYAYETTDCCRRQLQTGCCHDCAPYDVRILYTPPGHLNQEFLSTQRACQPTCCCFNRPVATVYDQTTRYKIGSFRDPCTCCLLKFQIRDHDDSDVLVVDGGCCCTQPGMCCPLPCGPCSKVEFDVKDAQHGQTVAHITKKVPSCLTWCIAPDVDNYHVSFEQVQNQKWKAILMAFTIFMDFRYFNTNRNEENAQQRWGN
jgi:hypothetical protein